MLQDLWSQFPGGLSAVATVCGLIYLVWTRLSKAISLYDGHWARRRYKLLKELRADDASNGAYGRYLDEAIYLENFRIVSGIRANKGKADALVQLSLNSHWNSWQIRKISRYLFVNPNHPKPTLIISKFDVAGAWISLLFASGLAVSGLAVGVAILYGGITTSALFLALFEVTLLMFCAGAVAFSTEGYRVARRFQQHLDRHPDLLDAQPTPISNDAVTPALEAVVGEPPLPPRNAPALGQVAGERKTA